MCRKQSVKFMQTINSRVIKTELIKWREVEFVQDDDFKEWFNDGDEKLLKSILKYQFIDPFKVWENGGKLYCLDGKHRFRDLEKVAESGIEVPDLLPATFIDCADMKEAAELVLVFSSAYARITVEGAFNFTQKFDLNFDSLKELVELPGLDLNILNDRYMAFPDEVIGLVKSKPITLTITFKTKKQLETIDPLIKDLLKKECPEAFYSVSAGEL